MVYLFLVQYYGYQTRDHALNNYPSFHLSILTGVSSLHSSNQASSHFII